MFDNKELERVMEKADINLRVAEVISIAAAKTISQLKLTCLKTNI